MRNIAHYFYSVFLSWVFTFIIWKRKIGTSPFVIHGKKKSDMSLSEPTL